MLASCFALTALTLVALWAVFDGPARPATVALQPGVFSPAECAKIVEVVSQAAWDRIKEAQGYLPTNDISISELPALANVSVAVRERMLPRLREAYDIDARSRLHVADLYVVRYRPGELAGLRLHTDAYTLSFSITLNAPAEFGKGGLAFALLPGKTFREELGTAVMFPAKQLHGAPRSREGRGTPRDRVLLIDLGEFYL